MKEGLKIEGENKKKKAIKYGCKLYEGRQLWGGKKGMNVLVLVT